MKLNMYKFPQNVLLKTTAAVACGYLGYNSTVGLTTVSKTVNNTTWTISDAATDGTHIWLRANNKTTVKYNGVTCTFTRNSNVFMITIPDNYDPTIPFTF